MVKMQQIQPKLTELQTKYKNDPQKQQQEMAKLYKEHNVNPAGGCLPMLIQLPILLCLYQVISYPLTFMRNMNDAESWICATKYASEFLANKGTHSMAQIVAAKEAGLINFNLFNGMDLSLVPWQGLNNINLLWLIPIFAGVTTFLSSKLTSASGSKKDKNSDEPEKVKRILNPEDTKQGTSGTDQAQSMTKTMTYFMPLFTVWIAFTYPAALGFYWGLSNVLAILQQIYLNRKYGDKYKEEVAAIEEVKEKERKERKKLKQKRK